MLAFNSLTLAMAAVKMGQSQQPVRLETEPTIPMAVHRTTRTRSALT